MAPDDSKAASPEWSWERLRELAPDGHALSRGRGLFFSNNWQSLGGDGEWLWGVYEPRNGQPIETAVHLIHGHFHCSCRNRARPCPHNIALLLFLINGSEKLRVGTRPEWLDQRPAGPRPDAPPRVSNDRRAARLAEMTQGITELRRWLADRLRRGLSEAEQQTDDFFQIATRMQDYKLGGIARRLRNLPDWLAHPNWPDLLLEELGRLYFFTATWQNRDALTADQRWELVQIGGLNLRKEEVYQQPAIEDRWLVLGQLEGEEELRFRRVYLRGEQSKRIAQLLDFAHGNQPMPQHWSTGALYRGSVFFYPGTSQLRGLFPEPVSDQAAYDGLEGLSDFEKLSEAFAEALSRNPWLYSWPVLLDEVRAQLVEEVLYLFDRTGARIELQQPTDGLAVWKVLSISGGKPMTVFGEWTGRLFTPLSIVSEGRVIGL